MKTELVHLTVPKPLVVKNKFKVPKKQWAKWRNVQQKLFNELYETMAKNQELYLHPMTEKQSPARWQTTCWNAAWTAADFA